jgi:O-antigen/teichoic acid export membrane protein
VDNYKQKTVSGLTWSFIDNFSNLGIQFIVGIILARILSPKEFGLLGLITVFIAVSSAFIDSGFSNSLIRKKDCTQQDYSTVFYFNIAASIIFYLLLFVLAVPISSFFKEPQLVNIIRVVGVSLIISSFSLIQRTILTKRVDFKLQTKISIISSILSGVIGIYMAFSGFGVWSLVWKSVLAALFTTILLWLWNHWYPLFLFNFKIFKEHFKFGYKLLLSGLIDTIYKNVYYLIIGKFFSSAELGFYTRAEQFSSLPSSNITGVISRVSYPVLSQLQEKPEKLKDGYKKLIKNTMFITFILMMGMAAVAKPLILTLIGAKWASSIIYLQLLCFSAMLYPLQALNLNMLNVKGRSDLFLKLEIIKKLLAIPVIFVAIFLGIKAMLIGFIILSFASYFLNAYWSGRLIDYSIKEQVMDIVPSFLLALFMGFIVFGLGYFVPLKPLYLLLLQFSLGAFITISFSKIIKLEEYMMIREIVLSKLSVLKKLFHANE